MRAATWLLTHVADDALAGDLIEEYHGGRTLAWYWREVLAAALLAGLASLRRHKIEALCATIAAWTFMTLWGRVAANEWREFHQSDEITMITRWAGYFITGLIVGRYFRFPSVAVVLVPLAAGTLARALDTALTWMPPPMQPPVERALDPALCIILGAAVAAWSRTLSSSSSFTKGIQE